jgi:ABC-type lipoprotein export system ATPase subunit
VNGYAGNWPRFLDELEALPKQFKVLGINDYLFLDGYCRLVIEKRDNGRLRNIELLLPVIEFRIAKFAGVEFRNTTRINLHVIFSDLLGADLIQAQFLNALSSKYCLDSTATGITWSGVVTKESLARLGADVKASVPPEKLAAFGSDLIEGFRNLNISEKEIFSLLEENTFLRGQCLTALGKSEWDKLNWTEGSIAEKKDVINGVNLIFTSAENPEAFTCARKALLDQRVNSRLLDCSDAHHFTESKLNNRIGNCFTWIKSDPTFDGLAQTLTEFEERVFVGERPLILERVAQNPTKFATSVKIGRTSSATTSETWFRQEIPLNAGLIAVIGRKGSGKSALAEIVALLGNTHRHKEFTFLEKDRFRNAKSGLADQFEGRLNWSGGPPSGPTLLSTIPSLSDVERVAYLPQLFLERICNEIAEGESGRFYSELQGVIFSHIPVALQYGCGNLSELIKLKTEEREKAISILKEKLAKLNSELYDAVARNHPDNRDRLAKQYKTIFEEIKSLRKTGRPLDIPKPATGDTQNPVAVEVDKLKQSRRRLLSYKDRVQRIRDRYSLRLQLVGKLRARINNLRNQFDEAMLEVEEIARQLDLNASDLIELKITTESVDELEEKSKDLATRAATLLDASGPGSLTQKLQTLEASISRETEKLTASQRQYEKYLEELSTWRGAIYSLIGNDNLPNSARGLEAERQKIETLPSRISALLAEQIDISEAIFAEKIALQETYRELHRPVQDFIETSANTEVENQLSFSVAIQESGFADGLLQCIHQGRVGSFMGQSEGRDRAQRLLDSSDFSTAEGLRTFLAEIKSNLEFDRRSADPQPVELERQLLDGVTAADLDNFLFGLDYLKPEFELGWGGKHVNQLSPGEKGTLLLVFYLLVDQFNIPFVIDQPEENLDNETVFQTLVPCVRRARNRRQVILVTHNPNLAVVCDADQIIHAAIDKTAGNTVTYTSGSIEDKAINQLLVDVLEGTRPAFDSREAKYEISKRSSKT